MTEKYKIMSEFVKDLSSETPDIKAYLFVKDNIHKYHLNIEITSKALKDKIIEINTQLTLHDKEANETKANFEMIYTTIIRLENEINDKKELQKIILCDVQNKIYPEIEKIILKLVVDSGYPETRPNKKVNFEELYKNRKN